jgi:hypothetical protein
LIEFGVQEVAYLAGKDKRSVTPRKDLKRFLDESIIEELSWYVGQGFELRKCGWYI